ncbi:hypothetical protein SCHPADRAFT_948193 [Schizopora paradoxa]|uniref:Uncharacterized protein n=1 Tax=Schizopora paradoxa TaxID=27342 RepID=A0A0H2QWI7_9AGAM|nr:hypothetical protein SCHPADRAFT_948193 [Schizopora paradoxa]
MAFGILVHDRGTWRGQLSSSFTIVIVSLSAHSYLQAGGTRRIKLSDGSFFVDDGLLMPTSALRSNERLTSSLTSVSRLQTDAPDVRLTWCVPFTRLSSVFLIVIIDLSPLEELKTKINTRSALCDFRCKMLWLLSPPGSSTIPPS